MWSALKYQGKPLYEYARQGIEVPREPRTITVFELQLLESHFENLEDGEEAFVRLPVVRPPPVRNRHISNPLQGTAVEGQKRLFLHGIFLCFEIRKYDCLQIAGS